MSTGGGTRQLPNGQPRPRYDGESLLAVAVQVFTERGYDGTSMEDLSKASGLSKSSLYHHFESKEQVLRVALERAVEPLLAVLDEENSTSGKAIDRLTHVVRREVEVLTERLPFVTLLLRVHGNTATERWALQQRRAFDKAVAALVQQAIDEGDVRDDADARTTARLIFGTVNSLVEWWRPGSRTSPTLLADQVAKLTLSGIRA